MYIQIGRCIMEKGELLGSGMTADVYKWGPDKVLKLYKDKYNEEWIKREAEITKRVHEAGVPSPSVFDMIEIEGRKGVIFERVSGNTMTSSLLTEPWNFFNYLIQTARLQYKIHNCSTDGIPSQKEKFELAIGLSSEILGDKVKKILDYVDSLPDGDSICHGDLYLSNIIISRHGPVVIDWTSGYRGDPCGDIARTCLIMNSHAVLPGTPDILAEVSRYPKWLSYQTYVNEYVKIAKIKFESIDAWMLPVAAVKLKDKIPGEKKWLLKIINNRLEQL
jgi:uncharacterized protein (TIGR02172 family)